MGTPPAAAFPAPLRRGPPGGAPRTWHTHTDLTYLPDLPITGYRDRAGHRAPRPRRRRPRASPATERRGPLRRDVALHLPGLALCGLLDLGQRLRRPGARPAQLLACRLRLAAQLVGPTRSAPCPRATSTRPASWSSPTRWRR